MHKPTEAPVLKDKLSYASLRLGTAYIEVACPHYISGDQVLVTGETWRDTLGPLRDMIVSASKEDEALERARLWAEDRSPQTDAQRAWLADGLCKKDVFVPDTGFHIAIDMAVVNFMMAYALAAVAKVEEGYGNVIEISDLQDAKVLKRGELLKNKFMQATKRGQMIEPHEPDALRMPKIEGLLVRHSHTRHEQNRLTLV